MHAASYFAGVGTVVATMAIGFGGGVFLTDAFVGKSERTQTLMERRAAPLSESTAPVVAAAPQAAPQPATAPAPPSTPAMQERPQIEQSMGRTQDADLQDPDAEARKATVAEHRKQERRKWTERRKREMRKIDELTAMSEKVKQREREAEFRSFANERGSPRLPLINLFGGDDD